MEYPCCHKCNFETRAADAAASFFSRIDFAGTDTTHWKVQEALIALRAVVSLAPDFYEEIFGEESARESLIRMPSGLLIPVAETQAGPVATALLTVFAAKLGMALYYEHIREPLPAGGAVYTIWFLNAGLSGEAADGILSILPTYSTLVQGRRRNASGQFDYRYNSDDRSIVATLSHFHGNVHFFTFAAAEPDKYPLTPHPHMQFTEVGRITDKMPKPKPAIVLPKAPNLSGRGLVWTPPAK